MTQSRAKIEEAARVALANGRRLIDDADYLIYGEPPTTASFLASIAQEEVAKSFLLALSARLGMDWTPYLARAARDHSCKQLFCIVMDYLSPDTDAFLRQCKAYHEPLPEPVIHAIEILRHEKIRRWESRRWVWAEDPAWNLDVLAVAEGQVDRLKQDALYVRLHPDGRIASIPQSAARSSVERETERARRFGRLVESVLDGEPNPALYFADVEEVFRVLFEAEPREVSVRP